MKQERAMLKRKKPDKFDGKRWTYLDDEVEVIVMAVVGVYAMVRRPKCTPFVVWAKELVRKQ
jgi:hypothetical protein